MPPRPEVQFLYNTPTVKLNKVCGCLILRCAILAQNTEHITNPQILLNFMD